MKLFDPKFYRLSAIYMNAVITKAALILGGYYLGDYLDTKWGTAPYMMLILIVTGLILGLTWIVYVAKRFKL